MLLFRTEMALFSRLDLHAGILSSEVQTQVNGALECEIDVFVFSGIEMGRENIVVIAALRIALPNSA